MLTNLQTDPEWEVEDREHPLKGESCWTAEELEPREKENPLHIYLRDIGRYPLLTCKEEQELGGEIQDCQENLVRLFVQIPIFLREVDRLKRWTQRGRQNVRKVQEHKSVLIEKILSRLRRIDPVTAKHEGMERLLDDIYRVEARLRRASDRMVRCNQRLVVSISRSYLNMGLPMLDLIQEGNLGLMKAVARFDPSRGPRFSTCAVWWIRQAIQRAIGEKSRTIRMPVHMLEALNRYRRLMLSSEEPGNLLPEQIMKKARLSRGQWKVIQNSVDEPVSLDRPASDGKASLIDFVPDRETMIPSEVAIEKELSEKLSNTLRMLSPRQEKVIRQRFGISYARDYTLDEIGRQLGLSRQRIRQIEKKALEKLKEWKCRKELKQLRELFE